MKPSIALLIWLLSPCFSSMLRTTIESSPMMTVSWGIELTNVLISFQTTSFSYVGDDPYTLIITICKLDFVLTILTPIQFICEESTSTVIFWGFHTIPSPLEAPCDYWNFDFHFPKLWLSFNPSSLFCLVSCNNEIFEPNKVRLHFNNNFLLGVLSPLVF